MKSLMIAGALLAMSAGAAFAADAAPQVRVTAAGLNLGQSADAQAMLGRLDEAALNACGASKFSFSQVRDATRAGDCYKAAMSNAVTSLGSPVVTNLYRNDARSYAAR
ncbi:MAG: hypothetical protein BGN86_13720 [Caulobacterales bacterium 68-7]|nr:MAG: hypothetical protein BGN86_13720 [Caulobacterales bacterium 68-7]